MPFIRTIVYFILATIPILFGSVQIWVWPFYTFLMLAAFAALLWASPRVPHLRPGRAFYLALMPFFAAALFLCLPLPPALVAGVSPFRHQAASRAADLLNTPLAWTTLSYRPLESLAWMGFLLGLVLFFFVLAAHLEDRRHLRATVWLLFGLAVAQALYGILQALVPNMPVLWATYIKAYMGDARGTWVNRNHFAGFIEMVLPLCLGLIVSRVWGEGRFRLRMLLASDRPHRLVLFCVGIVVVFLALLFSRSRAGITATFLGLAVFLSLLRPAGRGKIKAAWGLLGVMLLLVIFYGSHMGFDPLINRFLALDTEASRLDFWRDSLAIIGDHPLGIGPRALPSVFKLYDVSVQLTQKVVYELHNDVLQILVDTGWVGFVALVGGFAWFMASGFRRLAGLDAARDPERFLLCAGAMSGLSAMAFHSFFDFNLQIPANGVYFVTLMAIVRNCTHRKDRALRASC
jgi:O-antigen ligase